MSTPISEIIPFLERSLSANIIEWATAPLTAKGENYGSTMLSVEVKAKFDDAEHLLNDDVSSEFLGRFWFRLVLKTLQTN